MCSTPIEGEIIVNKNELNLNLTLCGGQSFRWSQRQSSSNNEIEYKGVAYNAFWILCQREYSVSFKVFPAIEDRNTEMSIDTFQKLLTNYFRLDFNLFQHIKEWKLAHTHFSKIESNMEAVRVLRQEPLENILSFICSQNNNIKRISTMVNWLCSNYGSKIVSFEGVDEYTFPTLENLLNNQNELESKLRKAKFGYRAKFIVQTIRKIASCGGEKWLSSLIELPYDHARLELLTLPGIGYKVADCICLMSLNHLEAVPIDTHIFKIAQSSYMSSLSTIKTVTPKIYNEIAEYFRNIYGRYAGWAQAVLFCSGLQQFQEVKINRKDIKNGKRKKTSV